MCSLVFAASLVPASVVQSAEIEGVRFPEQLQMGEAQLRLRGTGLLWYHGVDTETLESPMPRIASFNELYEDIEPGNRYSLTYLPGRGAEFARNGQTKGTVAGVDFASALFSIGLGPRTPNDAPRRDLLANR